MAVTIDKDALIADLEAAWEDEGRASVLSGQAREIKKSVEERLADFAKDCEVSTKIIKEAYDRFKVLKKKQLKASDEDYYACIEAVDEYFINEEESENKDADESQS